MSVRYKNNDYYAMLKSTADFYLPWSYSSGSELRITHLWVAHRHTQHACVFHKLLNISKNDLNHLNNFHLYKHFYMCDRLILL